MTACALLVTLAVLFWPTAATRLGELRGDVPGPASGEAGEVGASRLGARGVRGAGRSSAAPRTVAPDEIAVVMDLIAAACRSGRGVDRALRLVGEVSTDPVRADLARVTAALAWGVDAATAWAQAGPKWQSVARTLGLAARAGVAPADALTRAADDLRAEQAQALDVAAARLGVVMVVPLGLAFLPAFVLLTVVPVVIALARQLVR
ncbi:MAG: type II secretion system F family protein [Dermatophilaceae bacterium]